MKVGKIMSSQKKLTLMAFILMILTSVFGVVNIGIGFYKMGYAAIPMYIIGGLFFFIPFVLMMIEFGTGFRNEKGGIYSWMEKSVSVKFAMIGIMMWYASYVIWMFNKAFTIWIPLSFAIFGEDITTNPVYIGNSTIDFGPLILGIVGIILIAGISYLVTRGPSKLSKVAAIGGISVIALNVILLVGGVLVFFINGMQLQEPISAQALITSPNPDYQSVVPYLGFLVFAVFAFGGMEAMAGVADDLENPHRDLKRGVFLAAGFIIVCYVLGFLMVGSIMAWAGFGESVGSLQALFIIMENLGNELAGEWLGEFLKRFAGLGMFFAYAGAMITLAYAPLKQLIGGTPKEFWPESFQKENEFGIRVSAVKVQAIIVSAFIGSKALFTLINPEGAQTLYELLLTMTNVSMTIPYLFLIVAWYKYRTNDSLEKDLTFFKSKVSILFATISTFVLVSFGNIFTIIDPLINGDMSTFIWTVVGPLLFALIALVIYNRGKNK
jgi:amino acid transporter